MDPPTPRWRIYVRFVIWALPAFLALLFSAVILLPRLEKNWEAFGTGQFDETPAEWLIDTTPFLLDNFRWLLIGFLLVAAAWEIFTRRRPNLRHWFYEIAAWLFNLVALAQIIFVAILALL